MTFIRNTAFITSLLTASALSDEEVRAELLAEVQREQHSVDLAMAAIVAEGRRRTFYLSSAIYDPVAKAEQWLAISKDALARNRDPKTKPYIENAIQQQTVELDIARRLRALREPISHMDPPDYWDRLRRQHNAQTISCNPDWRDAA